MKVIAVSNQKGGVGKTTTAWHLAKGLENRGNKVLIIDMDPQCNLAFTANVDLMHVDTNLYQVLTDKLPLSDAVIELTDNLHIVIGGIDLAAADRTFTQLGREKMLKKLLEPLKGQYDYCIIDTPPTLGVINENALTCSDTVIIPMQADAYTLQGVNQLYGFIQDIKENANESLNIEGILITRADTRTTLYKTLEKQFKKTAEKMNTKLFDTVIRSTVSVGEAALNRDSLYDYDPTATAAGDYNNFIDELLRTI